MSVIKNLKPLGKLKNGFRLLALCSFISCCAGGVNYVALDTFCEQAERITLSHQEVLTRSNLKKILLYNCHCVGGQHVCNYDL